MANQNAKRPATLRIIDHEKFGQAVVGFALMVPDERPKTIGELKANFPQFNGAFDFTHVDDTENLIFDQGDETNHHIALPAFFKLIPMLELFLELDVNDFKIPGTTDHPNLKVASGYDLVDPAPGGEGYELPEFFEDVFVADTAGQKLSTDSLEFFLKRAGDYTYNGCRG